MIRKYRTMALGVTLLVAVLPLTVLAEVPQVAPLASEAWYWRWVATLGITAAVCFICFKNPQRSHDN